MSTGRPWTEEEDNTLMQLRRDGVTWEDIAERQRRSVKAIRSRYCDLRSGRVRLRRPNLHAEPAPNVRLMPEMLADRDARMEASWRRTPTQEFFGDPPPGYSALDKKRQAGARS